LAPGAGDRAAGDPEGQCAGALEAAMRQFLGVVVGLAAAILVAGCIEAKQDYTLNPDGSGKVVLDLLMQDMPAGLGQAEKPDPEVLSKKAVRRILNYSSGVSAWADVAYNRTEDGRTHFKGTAYFKDFSKVRFPVAGMSGISFAKDEAGGMVLAIEGGRDEAKQPPAAPPTLTDEEIVQRIKAQRDKFQQMRPMMEMVLAKTRMDLSFRLPGTVAEASNLQREPDGTVRLVLEGAKMLQTLDQLMADDAYMREVVTSGADAGQGNTRLSAAVNEKLFGTKAPVRARVTGDLKPLFDYEAEAKAAKDGYLKMVERLGLDPLPSEQPRLLPPGARGEGQGAPSGRGAGGASGGGAAPAGPAAK
jgi:hypothetical protein